MLTEVVPGAAPITNVRVFWWRMLDNLFRRIVWYLLPIVAFVAIGVTQAGNTLELYMSSAKLNAAGNPFVPDPAAGTASPTSFETTAGALARVINERIRTDEFTLAVAIGAGLPEDIDPELIRESVWASESGSTIVSINATWEDSLTSVQLVQSTINEASAYLRENVIRAAAAAESFYDARLTDLQEQRAAILGEYDAYVSTLPALEPGDEHDFSVQVQIGRLQDRLDAINLRIGGAQEDLDDALLSRAQLETEAGESFSVIDPPIAPSSPESTFRDQVALVGSFAMIGIVVAAATLLLTTALDRTVNAPAELLAVPGVSLVATAARPGRRWLRRSDTVPAIEAGKVS